MKALAGKAMDDDASDEMETRALSAIRLCLADDVLFNIVSETTGVGL